MAIPSKNNESETINNYRMKILNEPRKKL